jgi:mannose-6-phosphate isomerase-like protein (cupin superfamily)
MLKGSRCHKGFLIIKQRRSLEIGEIGEPFLRRGRDLLSCWEQRPENYFNNLNEGFSLMHPIHIRSAEGKKLTVLGIPMVIRIHGHDTGGVVSTVESHDVPGGGPPPHIHHREDETFQIIEGEYEWTVGTKKFVAQKGATIFAPRGIPHTYRYLGQAPGRLMCVITPAGFEGFFEEIDALAPQQQQEIPRVMEIAKKYGLEFPPPPGA